MGKIKSLIKTSAITTGILHIINKYIESGLAVNTNTRTSGKYYHWKHGNIYYKVCGQGSPVLLLHDLTVSSSNFEWSQILNKLAKNHTVYAVDLIGCGKSDKPLITYTNYFYVQMVQDFVTNVIGEKADVIASGLSSSFVIMANSADQSLFDNIIMLNPTDINELKKIPDEKSKMQIKLFQLPVIGKFLYYIAVNKENIEYELTENRFYSPFKVDPATVKSYYNAAHLANGSGKMLFASLKGNYLNVDISKALTKAENRIFLITGSQIKNREEIEASYLKRNKNIITFHIPKSKYLPQLEVPEQTLDLLHAI